MQGDAFRNGAAEIHHQTGGGGRSAYGRRQRLLGRSGERALVRVYTLVSPFSNAVFSLVVLLALNAVLRRLAPRAALTSSELLLVYVMVTMVSTISGHAMMAILTGALAHPFWFASPENQYAPAVPPLYSRLDDRPRRGACCAATLKASQPS